jgi:putative intracellular protease/amidase
MMPHKDGTAPHQTGLWLEEAAAPYYVFKRDGHEVAFASPKGGAVPVDPASMGGDFFTEDAKSFMHDGAAFGKLCVSTKVADLSVDDFDVLFMAGGHGTVADFVSNAALKKAIEDTYAANKLVAAVCHGPTALVQCEFQGKPLLDGKQVTGFTNAEEGPDGVNLKEKVAVVLEDAMKEKGGKFESADPWNSKVVEDGTLLTGQNPQSSKALAEAVAAKL